MRINQEQLPAIPQADRTTSVEGRSLEQEISSARPDNASIGSLASALSDAIAPRDARVAELRKQYLDGTYYVSAAKISSKMVDEHLADKS